MSGSTHIFSILVCLLLLINLPSRAQEFNQTAASLDSVFYEIYSSSPGTGAGFDFEPFGAERFDATGDGVPELITFEDVSGEEEIYVRDLKTGTDVLALSMGTIRQRMRSLGYSEREAADLTFRGFFRFVDVSDPIHPEAILFMTQGAPVIYDPSNNNLLGLQPEQWRLFAISDFDGDGWPDLVVGDKDNRIIEILGSRFSPGFSD